jgi:cytochrome c peroxidase
MKRRLSVLCITTVCATLIGTVWFGTGPVKVKAQTAPTLPTPQWPTSPPALPPMAPEPGSPGASGLQAATPTPYNPYPPGILPANLNSEILRVRMEVRGIETEAINQWIALTPPTVTGQPPTQQNTGVQAIQILGKLLNFDETMSPFKNRACAFCHMPYAAFSGPIPSVNLTMIAYPGSFNYRANKRTAQRYTYSSSFPELFLNTTLSTQAVPLFFGGNFWDSRATGYHTRNAAANQAQGPPVDPGEMSLPDTACIAFRLFTAPYRALFQTVWGTDSLTIAWPPNTEQICDTPEGAAIFGGNPEPIQLSPADRQLATTVYDQWAYSLEAYEQSANVSAFSSKFDAFLAGNYTLTPNEMAGYKLFNGKGNCNSCHLDGRGTALMPTQTDTSTNADTIPVFTCFGSANEGLPLNPRDSYYYETTPDFFGFTPNPYGFGWRDLGLGSFLRSVNGVTINGTAPNPNSTWTPYAPGVDGQFQVMSARNVALAPPKCSPTPGSYTGTTEAPGPYFQKEFFHNGYIKSLKQLVHFYNTRDTSFAYPVLSGFCPTGTVERVTCWPQPEVPNNLDMTTGMLGLTNTEEDQIVAFLMTLTDGFTTPYPDINTYTGTCATGGTAATQGNGFLLKVPAAMGVPCTPAVCGVIPFPSPPIAPLP